MLLKLIIGSIIGVVLGLLYGFVMGTYILNKFKKGFNDIKFWIIFSIGLFIILNISWIIEIIFF